MSRFLTTPRRSAEEDVVVDPSTGIVRVCPPRACRIGLGTTTTSCCFMAQSPKLRVLIMCCTPCSPIPGYRAPEFPPVINAPPLTTTTAGIPFGLSFAGRPGAYPDFGALPQAVIQRYGKAALTASSLTFDFGVAGTVERRGFMKGKGLLLAAGAGGAAQASTAFTYRWSRFPQCKDVCLSTFNIEGCTAKGLAFTVLDDSTYLSSNPCVPSIIILNCQQYCPMPDSTPATVSTCCTPYTSAITAEAACTVSSCGIRVLEDDTSSAITTGYTTEPTSCVYSPMSSLYIKSLLPCAKPVAPSSS